VSLSPSTSLPSSSITVPKVGGGAASSIVRAIKMMLQVCLLANPHRGGLDEHTEATHPLCQIHPKCTLPRPPRTHYTHAHAQNTPAHGSVPVRNAPPNLREVFSRGLKGPTVLWPVEKSEVSKTELVIQCLASRIIPRCSSRSVMASHTCKDCRKVFSRARTLRRHARVYGQGVRESRYLMQEISTRDLREHERVPRWRETVLV